MKRAVDYRCPFCGQVADHLHHMTGRDAFGSYLDPGLRVPLTRRCHVVEHQTWRIGGMDDGVGGSPNSLRLLRSGLLLVRLGEHHEDGSVWLPASTVRELGRMQVDISRQLVDATGGMA